MKKVYEVISRKAGLLIIALLSTAYAFAQDNATTESHTSVSKTTTSSPDVANADWYTAPWVWVAGGALFILILVALLRGRNRTTDVNRTTVTRTDVTSNDV